MAARDVDPGEMHEDELTKAQVDRLVNGSLIEPDLAMTAAFLDEMRLLRARVQEPRSTGALAEFIGVDFETVKSDQPAMAVSGTNGPVVQVPGPPTSHESTRRSKMFSITAFAGTVAGKIAIGATMAAASMGGAYAAGVDVSLQPDTDNVIAIAAAADGAASAGQAAHTIEQAEAATTATTEQAEAAASAATQQAEAAETAATEQLDATAHNAAELSVVADAEAVAAAPTSTSTSVEAAAAGEVQANIATEAPAAQAADAAAQARQAAETLARLGDDFVAEIASINADHDAQVSALVADRVAVQTALSTAITHAESEIAAAVTTINTEIDAELALIEAMRSGLLADIAADEQTTGGLLDLGATVEVSVDVDVELAVLDGQIVQMSAERKARLAGAVAARDTAVSGTTTAYTADIVKIDHAIAEVEVERQAALSLATSGYESAKAGLGG